MDLVNQLPVIVVSGVDPDTMAAVTVGLQWDLPSAVVVRQRVQPDPPRVGQVTSDATGILDDEWMDLDHDCVPCSLSSTLVTAVQRVRDAGRWESVIALLAPAVESRGAAEALAALPGVRVAGVVAAVDGETVSHDLLADDLLRERGRHHHPADARSVGEVLAAQVESADAIVTPTGVEKSPEALLRTLARPGVVIADRCAGAESLRHGWHLPELTEQWCAPDRTAALAPVLGPAWQLDLRSERPFHPDRLLEEIALLGTGPHRSRGCFHLPTRPDLVGVWDGAGGQLSIGRGADWRDRTPFTRIVVVGQGEPPADLPLHFERLLVTPAEWRRRGRAWEALTDGFEPWLGPIRRAA